MLMRNATRFDYEGRVVRLDTFSKTVAPGSRLGWVTGSPVLVDRILRVGEVSTQAPCGFGQVSAPEVSPAALHNNIIVVDGDGAVG